MATYDIFPSKLVIQDRELTEQQIKDLTVAVQAIFMDNAIHGEHTVETRDGNFHSNAWAEPFAVWTPENLKIFPVLQEVKDIFIDGFYELAQAHEFNNLSRDDVATLFADNYGQIPIMQTGGSLPVHTHPGAVASAVFYLTDVDNGADGGMLSLRDPSFNTTAGFRNDMEMFIETKAGRLVVFPTHIWHDVTPYHGKEDRMSMVANLSFFSEAATKMLTVKGD